MKNSGGATRLSRTIPTRSAAKPHLAPDRSPHPTSAREWRTRSGTKITPQGVSALPPSYTRNKPKNYIVRAKEEWHKNNVQRLMILFYTPRGCNACSSANLAFILGLYLLRHHAYGQTTFKIRHQKDLQLEQLRLQRLLLLLQCQSPLRIKFRAVKGRFSASIGLHPLR